MHDRLCQFSGLHHINELQQVHTHLPSRVLRQNIQKANLYRNVYVSIHDWAYARPAQFGGNRGSLVRPEKSGVHLGPNGYVLLHGSVFRCLSVDTSDHHWDFLYQNIHYRAQEHQENNGSHVHQSQLEVDQTRAHAFLYLFDFFVLLDSVRFDYCDR